MPLTFIKVPLKKSQGLRKLLHKELAGTGPGRSYKNLHASDVTYSEYQFCARERAYATVLKKQPPLQFLSTSENVTYDIGHFVEHKVIDTLAKAGIAVGDWKCKHCGHTVVMSKLPSKCQKCGHKHFKYIEQRILSEETGVSCGLDVLVLMPGEDKYTVIEVKSIDKEKFKELVAPLGEHGQRTKLYLKCLAESAQPVAKLIRHDRAYVLYVSKGGYGVACEEVPTWDFKDSAFSPFKDYLIERDDESLKGVLEQPLAFRDWYKKWQELQANEDYEAMADLALPPKICSSSLDKRAKKCSCLSPCFIKPMKFGKAKEG
jgi:predicted  nucleic acid-binding Zn-ribbon protein